MSARRSDFRGLPPGARAQQGIALVTVLLVLALCTALVARVAFANQIWLRQVGNHAAQARATEALRAAQAWIGLLLERDDRSYDGATDTWAQRLPPVPIGAVELNGAVSDLQGRFNLNTLVNTDGAVDQRAVSRLNRLLQLLRIEPAIAGAIADWIDVDDQPTGAGGAERAFYQSAEPPRDPANRPFATVAELRQVRGIDRTTWRILEPYVAALPGRTTVNVNTASAEVLASMLLDWGPPEQILSDVRYWVEDAARNPARALDEFTRRTRGDGDPLLADSLGVASNHFVARLGARSAPVEAWEETYFRRDESGRIALLARRRVFP